MQQSAAAGRTGVLGAAPGNGWRITIVAGYVVLTAGLVALAATQGLLGLAAGVLVAGFIALLAVLGSLKTATLTLMGAFATAPMYKGLVPEGQQITPTDVLFVVGFALLLPHVINRRISMPISYIFGVSGIAIFGAIASTLSEQSFLSLLRPRPVADRAGPAAHRVRAVDALGQDHPACSPGAYVAGHMVRLARGHGSRRGHRGRPLLRADHAPQLLRPGRDHVDQPAALPALPLQEAVGPSGRARRDRPVRRDDPAQWQPRGDRRRGRAGADDPGRGALRGDRLHLRHRRRDLPGGAPARGRGRLGHVGDRPDPRPGQRLRLQRGTHQRPAVGHRPVLEQSVVRRRVDRPVRHPQQLPRGRRRHRLLRPAGLPVRAVRLRPPALRRQPLPPAVLRRVDLRRLGCDRAEPLRPRRVGADRAQRRRGRHDHRSQPRRQRREGGRGRGEH
ncbi:hypothetical protein [Nocardioides convexus]|uniref:hypothetical protein n=1 Tax=Nocardioides convexus TaxID=2712224 RepID=UPI002418884F|nr:hypothetical protein [Nocardioides convexus]